jgi:predicted membrane protein
MKGIILLLETAFVVFDTIAVWRSFIIFWIVIAVIIACAFIYLMVFVCYHNIVDARAEREEQH